MPACIHRPTSRHRCILGDYSDRSRCQIPARMYQDLMEAPNDAVSIAHDQARNRSACARVRTLAHLLLLAPNSGSHSLGLGITGRIQWRLKSVRQSSIIVLSDVAPDIKKLSSSSISSLESAASTLDESVSFGDLASQEDRQ